MHFNSNYHALRVRIIYDVNYKFYESNTKIQNKTNTGFFGKVTVQINNIIVMYILWL